MKMILLGVVTFIFGSHLYAQIQKNPLKLDTIPPFSMKQFTLKVNPILPENFVQKLPNNLIKTGKKANNGFDIYIADIDKMSVLIPNTQNPNYIGNKSSNDLEFK